MKLLTVISNGLKMWMPLLRNLPRNQAQLKRQLLNRRLPLTQQQQVQQQQHQAEVGRSKLLTFDLFKDAFCVRAERKERGG